jgi:hypothetical protein
MRACLLLFSLQKLRFFEVFIINLRNYMDYWHVSRNLYIGVECCADKTSIQNVMNTTRLFVNPPFEEVVKFREGWVLVVV